MTFQAVTKRVSTPSLYEQINMITHNKFNDKLYAYTNYENGTIVELILPPYLELMEEMKRTRLFIGVFSTSNDFWDTDLLTAGHSWTSMGSSENYIFITHASYAPYNQHRIIKIRINDGDYSVIDSPIPPGNIEVLDDDRFYITNYNRYPHDTNDLEGRAPGKILYYDGSKFTYLGSGDKGIKDGDI